jgi:hypothetical protein
MTKAADPATSNPLCGKCLRPCKQPLTVVLLECPRFFPLPFKVERHRFDQLDLFGKETLEKNRKE